MAPYVVMEMRKYAPHEVWTKLRCDPNMAPYRR
jgi:hypothetical protein